MRVEDWDPVVWPVGERVEIFELDTGAPRQELRIVFASGGEIVVRGWRTITLDERLEQP